MKTNNNGIHYTSTRSPHAQKEFLYSPISERKTAPLPDFRFTWIDFSIVVVSMTTYLADILTGMHFQFLSQGRNYDLSGPNTGF